MCKHTYTLGNSYYGHVFTCRCNGKVTNTVGRAGGTVPAEIVDSSISVAEYAANNFGGAIGTEGGT